MRQWRIFLLVGVRIDKSVSEARQKWKSNVWKLDFIQEMEN